MSILAPLIILAAILVIVGITLLALSGSRSNDEAIARLRELQAGKPHLCEHCVHDFSTCPAKRPVFAKDLDPYLAGAAADRMISCDAFSPTMEVKP